MKFRLTLSKMSAQRTDMAWCFDETKLSVPYHLWLLCWSPSHQYDKFLGKGSLKEDSLGEAGPLVAWLPAVGYVKAEQHEKAWWNQAAHLIGRNRLHPSKSTDLLPPARGSLLNNPGSYDLVSSWIFTAPDSEVQGSWKCPESHSR